MRTLWYRALAIFTLAGPFACGGQAPLAATPPPCPEPPAAPTAAAPAEASPPAASDATLVLRGTPPIPAELRARMNRYLDVRSASLGAISDDGKSLLVTTRFAETFQVHLVESPMGAREQVTFRAEPVHSTSFVPGRRDALLFMSDVGGNEQNQIYRLDLGTRTETLLTDGKSRHGGYAWSNDGKRIAYTSNARNGKDIDVHLGDGVTQKTGGPWLERQGHWNVLEWSKDDRKLLLGHYVSINESELFLADVSTKALQRLTPETPRASYRDAALSDKGDKVYVATDREGEFVELCELDVASGKLERLTADLPWNVESLELSPDGKTVAFVVNEGGYGVPYLLDTRTKKHRPVTGVPKGIVSGIAYAKKSGVLAFSRSSAAETGDAYTFDAGKSQVTRWTKSEMGGLPPGALREPTLIHFEAKDGRTIPAFYYRPEGPGPFPVVIDIHGGPEAQARPWLSPLTQFFAVEMKYAVLVPNVRGSDGYGKSYLLLDNGMKREDSVKDIGSLLDWVGRQGELDARRAAVIGGSYGGYMVLASLVHFPERLRAGVDVVGISNFVTFLENTKDYRRDLRRAEYGDERDPEMRAFLERISPVNNVDKIQSALFVAHGANDPRVPLTETDQIVRAVEARGNDVWYMVANNEGHGFRKRENRDTYYLLAAMFLEKQLAATD